jgi:hypothetical protein
VVGGAIVARWVAALLASGVMCAPALSHVQLPTDWAPGDHIERCLRTVGGMKMRGRERLESTPHFSVQRRFVLVLFPALLFYRYSWPQWWGVGSSNRVVGRSPFVTAWSVDNTVS